MLPGWEISVLWEKNPEGPELGCWQRLPLGRWCLSREVGRGLLCLHCSVWSQAGHFSWRWYAGIGGDMGMRHVNSAAARKSPVGQPLGILPPSGGFFWIPGSSLAVPEAEGPQRVMWCTVGHDEHVKCNQWSALSGGILTCTGEESTEDCIAAVAVRRTRFCSCLGHSDAALLCVWWWRPLPHVFPSAVRLRHACYMLPPQPHSLKPHPTGPTSPFSSGRAETEQPRTRIFSSALDPRELWGVLPRPPVDCGSKSTLLVPWTGLNFFFSVIKLLPAGREMKNNIIYNFTTQNSS